MFTALLMFLSWDSSLAQTTSFTYQGKLSDNGSPANGNYDLQFALWDSLSGGSQIGVTQTVSAVAVSNGVFLVTLDFGGGAFTGANRFLEIGARPAGGGAFTVLAPRQQITSTPYAVRSLNASSADTVPANGVPAGSSNYIQNSSSPQSATNFNIGGNGSVGGTLSGNVVNATTQYNLGGNRVLGTPGTNNLFAGIGAGQANTGSDNVFVGTNAGQFSTSGSANTFIGKSAGISGLLGQPSNSTAVGANAVADVGSSTAIGANSIASGLNAISIGVGANSHPNAIAIGAGVEALTNTIVLGNGTQNTGVGTSAPQARFHVNGTSWFQGDTTPLSPSAGQGVAIGNVSGGGYIFAFDYGPFVPRTLLLNHPGGNVGIGTTTPDQTLTVNGNADKPGGGSWASFSDERLKNIKGRYTSGLKAVLQLQPLRYEYKRDNALNLKSEGEHIGFSAQAVQQIIPEAVSENEKGYLLINNDPILWTMLNAIKEQQEQIAKQQRQLEALRTEVQHLRNGTRRRRR